MLFDDSLVSRRLSAFFVCVEKIVEPGDEATLMIFHSIHVHAVGPAFTHSCISEFTIPPFMVSCEQFHSPFEVCSLAA